MTAPRHTLPRGQIRVLLLEGIHERAAEAFAREGYTRVEQFDAALSRPDLTEAIRDVHLLGIRSRTQVDAELLAAASKLIAVGCHCITAPLKVPNQE